MQFQLNIFYILEKNIGLHEISILFPGFLIWKIDELYWSLMPNSVKNAVIIKFSCFR